MLRQQGEKRSEIRNLSLADFVAPQSSGRTDYIGAFAVTAGVGLDEIVTRFEADRDKAAAACLLKHSPID